MNHKKLVVFDIAGTTIRDDNVVFDAFVHALTKFGVTPVREDVERVMGMSKKTAISLMLRQCGSDASIESIYGEFLSTMSKMYSDGVVEEIPGVTEVFSKLKSAGYGVALDTGFPRVILDVILKKTRWVENKLIDDTIASDELSVGRPWPYMIFRLMETLRVARTSDVVKVGDTIVDIEEGLNAGCGLVVGVTSGTCTREQFESSGHNDFVIIPDLNGLPNLLQIN